VDAGPRSCAPRPGVYGRGGRGTTIVVGTIRGGRSLEEADVPRLAETLDAYGRMIMTEFSLVWPMLVRLLTPDSRRHLELSMALRGPVDLAEYVKLTAIRQGLLRDWSHFLARYPLILGPGFTEQVVSVGYDRLGLEEFRRASTAMRLCTATGFVGVPAVAVPTHVAGGHLQGVQVIAGFYREDS